ncbi:MAG: FGGY family carbohydrate kinase, partial [Phycisphaeraceae bacterium]
MTSTVVTPDFYQQTGVARFTAQFMPAKLHWLRTHQPAMWRQARRVCSISEFLTLWFTGEHVAEAGAAALTGLVNIHNLAWRREPIEQLHFHELIFPTLARAGCPVGALRPDVADALKLPHKCQFTLGCLDQYAGAIGAGNVKPGGVSETTGTVLATVRLANYFDPNPAPDVFQGPAFQPSWHFRMIFGSVSANLLEAFRRSHAPDHSYAELDAEAAVVPSHCDGLTLDTHASERANAPIFRNVTASHTRGHHIRAILETVAVTLAQQVHQLHPEGNPRMVRSVGGAATSDLWMQIKTDELHTTMLTIDCAEPTSLGAAILAAATITNASVSDIAQQWVRTRSI